MPTIHDGKRYGTADLKPSKYDGKTEKDDSKKYPGSPQKEKDKKSTSQQTQKLATDNNIEEPMGNKNNQGNQPGSPESLVSRASTLKSAKNDLKIDTYFEKKQGIKKDGESTSKGGHTDDVNNEYDDNAPDTTNKSIACVPAQSTQRNHTSREDSEIPIKKPTECSTNTTTHSNDNLLEEVSKEKQPQNKKISTDSELVVSQLLKHKMSTTDTSGTTTLLAVHHETVKKLQGSNSIYPWFSALAGPAGESVEGFPHENSESQDCGDNDDVIMTVGAASGNTSFKSDPAVPFDPELSLC